MTSTSKRSRPAFISVGASCQRLIGWSGGSQTVLRRFNAAGRVDSSLRSHRTRRSQCRRVYSGLDKTLFASLGPDSLCRGHQPTLSTVKSECPRIEAMLLTSFLGQVRLGRMKASRGHRCDATCTPERHVGDLPPHTSWTMISLSGEILSHLFLRGDSGNLFFRSHSFLGFGFGFAGAGSVQMRRTVDASLAPISFLIAHQRVKDAQQPAPHGDVGLGPADPCEQALADRLLASVALAERNGCLTQCPAERGRAGLGDVATLRAPGRLLEVCRQSSPELQSVAVGETVKGTNLGGDDQTPDIADAGNTLQQPLGLGETFFSGSQEHIASQPLSVTFREQDHIEKVGEGLPLHRLSRSPWANSQRWALAPSNFGPLRLA